MPLTVRTMRNVALSTLLLILPVAAMAAEKGKDASTVTLILDFPLAFLNKVPAPSGEMADHQGHGSHSDHSAHMDHNGGHQHNGSMMKSDAGTITVAHKTFQDRLLIFKGEHVETVDGLRYSLPGEQVKAVSAGILTYFRRGESVRNPGMAISFSTAWKMVGVLSGGKEKVLQEGKITGGVRDFLKGKKTTPEIDKIKREVNPKSLPPFVLDDIEAALGLKGRKNAGYRLELRTSTDMTAIVAGKGKGSSSRQLTAFALAVTIKDGKRSRMELEFPYSRIEAGITSGN